MEQVYVYEQGSYFEGDLVSVVVCPTIRVLYRISGNFLTAPRTSLHKCKEVPSVWFDKDRRVLNVSIKYKAEK